MTITATVRRGIKFADAMRRWLAAGSPTRSPEKIEELFRICEACPKFVKHKTKPDAGNCSLCTCRLNLKGKINKLYMATESCPDDPPRWEAEIDLPIPPPTAEELAAEEAARQKRLQQPTGPIPPHVLETIRRRQERHRRRLARQQEIKQEPERTDPMPQEQTITQPSPASCSRREARRQRIEARQKRIAARQAREAALPPLIQIPTNDDPLIFTDREGHELANHPLRNLWAPNAGFLVCGGPSVNALDLSPLKERGIVSLAVNNVAGHVPVRAFVCGDPPEKFHHGIWTDPALIKFVPVRKLGQRVRAKRPDGSFGFTSLRVKDCPNVWGFRRDSHWEPEVFLSRDHATWGRGKKQAQDEGKAHILFSFFLGLRLMHYLGCRRVYLLGVDFSMDAEHGYAFDQARTPQAINGNNNSYRIAAQLCEELVPVFQATGYEVFNCNRRSRLTAWPYVPFDEAVEDCRGLTPREPFDLSQWYEKEGEPEERRTDD